MKRNTLIFDLDGTLLNTLGDLHISLNYAIKQFGYPERTIEEVKGFVGNGIKKAIERALPAYVKEEELNNIISIFKGYYKEHMLEHTKPYDGIIQMLDTLRKNGCKIGVVSNKFDDAVKGLCKNYFGNLVDIAIGEGYGIEKKPDPKGVIKAIKQLDSSCENSVYIGDSEVDIQTAQNAGLPCISVLWGFKDKNFLINNGAKNFAETPNDIIKIIEKNLFLS